MKRVYVIDKTGQKEKLNNWLKNNFFHIPGISENLSDELNANILIDNGWLYSEDMNEIIILTPEAEMILEKLKYGYLTPENLVNFYFWNDLINFFKI